jgi:hypothetical protein
MYQFTPDASRYAEIGGLRATAARPWLPKSSLIGRCAVDMDKFTAAVGAIVG